MPYPRWWKNRHKTKVVDLSSAMDAFIDGWMIAVKNDPWVAGSPASGQWTVGADDLLFEVTVRQWTDDEINDLNRGTDD